ncbi:MAG: tRNA-dihydrouridine synthase, partial [Gammaproteobacteria bacterium]
MSLSHKFCIAPMMQCTDIHDRFLFRLITRKALLYTEMVTTGAIIHGGCLEQLNFN